jgi:hypothetical protein
MHSARGARPAASDPGAGREGAADAVSDEADRVEGLHLGRAAAIGARPDGVGEELRHVGCWSGTAWEAPPQPQKVNRGMNRTAPATPGRRAR